MYMFPNLAPERARRNPPTDIFLPIIGSIYPIQTYKLYWHFTNQIQTYILQIVVTRYSVTEHILPTIGGYMSFGGFLSRGPTVRGPTVRGPNCPGPNCPFCQGGQLGPGQLGPRTVGPRTVRPRERNPPNDIYPPIVGRICSITEIQLKCILQMSEAYFQHFILNTVYFYQKFVIYML